MSYVHKMIGAVIAAFLIGGPLALIISFENKAMVGVGVGAIKFAIDR